MQSLAPSVNVWLQGHLLVLPEHPRTLGFLILLLALKSFNFSSGWSSRPSSPVLFVPEFTPKAQHSWALMGLCVCTWVPQNRRNLDPIVWGVFTASGKEEKTGAQVSESTNCLHHCVCLITVWRRPLQLKKIWVWAVDYSAEIPQYLRKGFQPSQGDTAHKFKRNRTDIGRRRISRAPIWTNYWKLPAEAPLLTAALARSGFDSL